MKVLVLNGSPKAENSNSLQLCISFLQGMKEKISLQEDILHVYKMNIKPCLGCYNCWTLTPGKCIIQDDMSQILEKILAADVIIWSFPLYFMSLPSQLKALMDRQLPMISPSMLNTIDSESGAHQSRHDLSAKKCVLISTCGLYTTTGNYDSINCQFDRIVGKNNYEAIYCGQGELFAVPELKQRTSEYLAYVEKAGLEFASSGISLETKEKLNELLFSREFFEQRVNDNLKIATTEKMEIEQKL